MKRLLAFFTAGALCCCLMASAFAEEAPEAAEAPEALETMEARAVYAAPAAKAAEDDGAPKPDPEGTLSFENLERRVRENNLTMQSLNASLASIDEIDFDEMKEDLGRSLSEISSAQWQVAASVPSLPTLPNPDNNPYISGINSSLLAAGAALSATTSMTVQSMQTQNNALLDAFEDLKDGTTQADYAASRRQIENAQNQFVAGAESLYAAMLEMRVQRRGLQRQLDALDRTVREMELRHDLGQVSALQLQEVKNGRTALASGIATLDMNIRNYTLQMETWVGAEQTGTLELFELPNIADRQIADMDLEKDLAAAKELSYTLFAAKRTLEDARESMRRSIPDYMLESARQNFKAAEYTYEAAVQNFELNFRTTFAKVGDFRQILEAKETALALEQSDFQAQALKYKQGTISKNAYLTAREALAAAEDAVLTAKHDLFTAYRTYHWAMTYGVLN